MERKNTLPLELFFFLLTIISICTKLEIKLIKTRKGKKSEI